MDTVIYLFVIWILTERSLWEHLEEWKAHQSIICESCYQWRLWRLFYRGSSSMDWTWPIPLTKSFVKMRWWTQSSWRSPRISVWWSMRLRQGFSSWVWSESAASARITSSLPRHCKGAQCQIRNMLHTFLILQVLQNESNQLRFGHWLQHVFDLHRN